MKYAVQIRDNVRLSLRQKLDNQGGGVPDGIRAHLHRCIEEVAYEPDKQDLVCIAVGDYATERAQGRFGVFALNKGTELPDIDPDAAKSAGDSKPAEGEQSEVTRPLTAEERKALNEAQAKAASATKTASPGATKQE